MNHPLATLRVSKERVKYTVFLLNSLFYNGKNRYLKTDNEPELGIIKKLKSGFFILFGAYIIKIKTLNFTRFYLRRCWQCPPLASRQSFALFTTLAATHSMTELSYRAAKLFTQSIRLSMVFGCSWYTAAAPTPQNENSMDSNPGSELARWWACLDWSLCPGTSQ